MRMKHNLFVLLAVFLLAACSAPTPPDLIVTQQPSPNSVIIASPILEPVNIKPTQILLPTVMPQFTPTQLPTQGNINNLPKLGDVILSSSDVENIIGNEYGTGSLVLAVEDVTDELQSSCLWDCAKYRYSLEHGILTIVLLRAGDEQKAESTVLTLRNDFLPSVAAGGYEYKVTDIPYMPPKSWVIVDAPSGTKVSRTSSASISTGSIVILVTYTLRFCEDLSDGGRYCEGDIMDLALNSIKYLMAQMQKLEAAGYQ